MTIVQNRLQRTGDRGIFVIRRLVWRRPLIGLTLSIAEHMTAIEREFLIKAFEVQEHLRPKASPDRIIPLLSWRTIGVLCNLTGEQSDALVEQLAATDQVRVMDQQKRLIMLSAGGDFARKELEERKRRFWNRVNWIVIPLALIIYWLVHGF